VRQRRAKAWLLDTEGGQNHTLLFPTSYLFGQ